MNAMIARMAKDSRSNIVKCHLKWQQHPAHGSFGRTTNTFKSSRRWFLRRTGGLYHQYSSPISTTLQGNRQHIINISVKLLVLILLPVNYTCQAQDEIQCAHWKQSQVILLAFRDIAFTSDSI